MKVTIWIAAASLLLSIGTVRGAFDDRLDSDKGRKYEGVEMIVRMHPVRTSPEINVGAGSQRMKAGEKVRSHFGRIAVLPGGKLIVTYNEQQSSSHIHDSTVFGLARTSTDGGYTWSPETRIEKDILPRIANPAQIRIMEHGLATLSDGTVWLSPLALDDNKYHIPRSRDGGMTWNFDLTSPSHVRFFHQMSNGEIIGVGKKLKFKGDHMGRSVFITKPGTEQWEIVHLRDQSGYEVDEACVVETATPGEVYMLLRDQERANYYYEVRSKDFGRTWEDYGPSGLWCSLRPSMPFVTRSADGTLLAIHSERSNGRIVVTPSFDGGHTWDLGRRIFVLDDPGPNGTLGGSHGYCSMAPTGEDTWFAVWYDVGAFRGGVIDTSYIKRPWQGICLAATGSLQDRQLVGRWSFEGDLRDIVIGQPNCDYGKATRIARTEGKVGRAIRFDGAASKVLIRDTPSMRVPNFFTVECFFRADRLEGQQAIVAKRPYYYLGLDGDKLTFQFGPPPGAQSEDMPTFRVDGETVIEAGRWYHVAVAVGTTHHSYKTASLYLDGKKIKVEYLGRAGMGRDWSYAKSAYYLDLRPEKGPSFMKYGQYEGYQVPNSAHLHLGTDNMTARNHFQGALDEVTLYGRCLTAEEIDKLAKRGYTSGRVTTDPIPLDGAGWGIFQAKMETPEGTTIRFDVLDGKTDQILHPDAKPGDSLQDIKVELIRLRAELSTKDPCVTPVLRSWAITGTGDD